MTLFDPLPEPRATGPERHLAPRRARPHLMSPADRVHAEAIYPSEKKAKEAGQERAVWSVTGEYLARFHRALFQLREDRAPFTIDNIIDMIGLPTEDGQNNAIGGLIAAAAKANLIKHVGYTETKRSGSHGRIIKVWEGCDTGRGDPRIAPRLKP